MQHYYKANNTADLAKKNLENILANGIYEKRQVGNWCMKEDKVEELIETYGVTFELTNPQNCITTQHCLGVEIETEDYILGLNPGFVHKSPWSFYKQWIKEDGKYHYTYGERGGKHIFDVIDKLKKEPTTRQCVVTLFDTSKDFNEKFVPCTTQWVFYISQGKLHMITTMRSQDACRGFFLDTFAYPLIQQIVAQHLDIPMGTYKHIIFNSHIYKDDIDFAKRILKNINNERPLIIDKITKDNMETMKLVSNWIFDMHDTVKAQEIAHALPQFWYGWKCNQIIYEYTKHMQKDPVPVELTCIGPVINVLPGKKTL